MCISLVTVIQKAQATLTDEQAYHRGLIDASLDGLVSVDPALVITDVNQTMCRLSGYSRDELIGSLFPEYFTDFKFATESVMSTLSAGAASNYELTLQTKSGQTATILFNASVFSGPDGLSHGIIASLRDISVQERLQHELTAQQSYNRSLIEASADALFAISPDGQITDVNSEAMRLTGHIRKHLLNSQFSTYFTDSARAEKSVRDTLRQGRIIGYELEMTTQQGNQIAVSLNSGVFSDSRGTKVGVLAAARDITIQKRLEQQLREQQYYTRSLIESNIDALMATDLLGIITDVNQQMELLSGCSRDELIGSPFKSYFTDPARAENEIQCVLREGQVTNYELTSRAKDGKETFVSNNAKTFNDRDGKLHGVFVAARDVTERKRVEQAIIDKNAELEKANQAKDRFLASMSHELRTPLNAIIGFTGTLLMQLPGPLNESQEDQLQTVERSANYLLSLINDLLDLARIESGNVELHLAPVCCRSVIEEVITATAHMAVRKNLRLYCEIPVIDVMLCTDRRALTQILLNLTTNALKFTEKGTVCIKLNQREEFDGSATEFSVIDTGIGIRPEDVESLFQPFYQVRGSTSSQNHGTGLGLHVSQKLAGLLGGEISFKSELNKGSTVTLAIKGKTNGSKNPADR